MRIDKAANMDTWIFDCIKLLNKAYQELLYLRDKQVLTTVRDLRVGLFFLIFLFVSLFFKNKLKQTDSN